MGHYFTSQSFTRPPEKRHRALLNFQCYGANWSVHFIEADCRTPIGKTRYIDFVSVEELRAFVLRCNPESRPGEDAMSEFDRDIRRWGRGSLFVNLTEGQYARLKVDRQRIRSGLQT